MRTSRCEPVVEDVERLSGSRARARRTRLTPSALGEGACERLAHRPGGREEDVLLAREVGRRSCASNNARASSLGDQCDARREPSSSKIDGSTSGRPRMEPLWSQAGATSGNRSQTEPTGYRLKEEMSQPVATHGNALGPHGLEGPSCVRLSAVPRPAPLCLACRRDRFRARMRWVAVTPLLPLRRSAARAVLDGSELRGRGERAPLTHRGSPGAACLARTGCSRR